MSIELASLGKVPEAMSSKVGEAASWPENCWLLYRSALGEAWFNERSFDLPMKKLSPRDHLGEFSPGNQRHGRQNGGSEGRWEFNPAGESLFALGSIDSVRRAAYRTAAGELRFLPL